MGAKARQQVVLERLIDAGYIDAEQAVDVASEALQIVEPDPMVGREAEFFVDQLANDVLPALLGPRIAARGGFTVTTSLDLELNEQVQSIAHDHVERLRDAHDLGAAAVVVMRPDTGQILAMVGGADYSAAKDGQVNMATSPRQLGSSYKVVGYATAIEDGWTAADVLWDIPHVFGAGAQSYTPVNYDGQYRGPVRLRKAVGNSLNAAAIDLAATVGYERIHEKSLELGLPLNPDAAQYGLSIMLGAAEVPLVDLTAVFATLANSGQQVQARYVVEVEDLKTGKTIYEPPRSGKGTAF